MTSTMTLERFLILSNYLEPPEGVAIDRNENVWCGGELGQVYCISLMGEPRQTAQLGGLNSDITLTTRRTVFACNPKRGVPIELDISGKELRSTDSLDIRFTSGATKLIPISTR
ncbi:MAG: hypothetical protein KGN79_01475 [Acidobacteriota bacterium]|nr:hypothetical protein [Acidobacteriota bacterium]